jgi:ribosomal protein S18 acetylase RimI-like enzyme
MTWKNDLWLSNILEIPCFKPTTEIISDSSNLISPALSGFYQVKVPIKFHSVISKLILKKFTFFDSHFCFELKGQLTNRNESYIYTLGLVEKNQLRSLQALAIQSFTNSRYYALSVFNHDRIDRIWSTWIADAVEDTERIVISANKNGEIIGFLSVKVLSSNSIEIDLLAISPIYRRIGLAEMLMRSTSTFLPGYTSIKLETETRNTSAVNLYYKLGFRNIATKLIFYKLYKI